MWSAQTLQLVDTAIAEDLGEVGDVTSALLPDPGIEVLSRVVPRDDGVICGLELGPLICRAFAKRLDQPLDFQVAESAGPRIRDGAPVARGCPVATVHGPKGAVLAVERCLLNFLSRMSGVATLTRRYVDAATRINPAVKILDTRKTIPGWRELDKYAVRCGGGHNHRTGLYDGVLIKDNHLSDIPTEKLADELPKLIKRLSNWPGGLPEMKFVEVEVDNLAQFAEVCKVGQVNIILVDNFVPDQVRQAIAQRAHAGRVNTLEIEASGGVTLGTVIALAATGIDRISIGALTHSAPAFDLGLDL